jgi:hypothetical protein
MSGHHWIYDYLLSDPELKNSHDGQAGMSAWFGAMEFSPVIGLAVGFGIWMLIRKVTRWA